uniref:Transposable element P transposase-like C-terminal domain-containing protein n=1 Tax=Schizaphis graminum TaxID=13262 RepID=A0A2S2PRY6_SCHGA
MDLLKCFEEQVSEKSIEDEAQEYVVGYVAKRFISKYPNLGYKTEKLHENETATSWIQIMSKGHLITPSNELLLADEVIKCLVRTRTFIRFNALNKLIEHEMPLYSIDYTDYSITLLTACHSNC